MTFNLPSNAQADTTRPLLILFLNLVDQLSSGKPALPDGASAKLVRSWPHHAIFESRAMVLCAR